MAQTRPRAAARRRPGQGAGKAAPRPFTQVLAGFVKSGVVRSLGVGLLMVGLAAGSFQVASTARGHAAIEAARQWTWQTAGRVFGFISIQVEKQVVFFSNTPTITPTPRPTETPVPTPTRTPRPTRVAVPTLPARLMETPVAPPSPVSGSLPPSSNVTQEMADNAILVIREYLAALDEGDVKRALAYWHPDRRQSGTSIIQAAVSKTERYQVVSAKATPVRVVPDTAEVVVMVDVTSGGQEFTGVEQRYRVRLNGNAWMVFNRVQ